MRISMLAVVILVLVGCISNVSDTGVSYSDVCNPVVYLHSDFGGYSSGVVFRQDKTDEGYIVYILTASHCVTDARGQLRSLRVDFCGLDAPKNVEMQVLGNWPEWDLAVLCCGIETPVSVAQLAPEDTTLFVGEPVIAAGCGFTQHPHYTTGIVIGTGDNSISLAPLVFTDVDRLYGDSGGPFYIKRDGKYLVVGVLSQFAVQGRVMYSFSGCTPLNTIYCALRELMLLGG